MRVAFVFAAACFYLAIQYSGLFSAAVYVLRLRLQLQLCVHANGNGLHTLCVAVRRRRRRRFVYGFEAVVCASRDCKTRLPCLYVDEPIEAPILAASIVVRAAYADGQTLPGLHTVVQRVSRRANAAICRLCVP
jgi:hypothetical protein